MSPHQLHLQHYKDRRFKVLKQLGENSACLVSANHKILRNGDAEYPFRQSSNLHYLSGWPEDEAMLLLLKKGPSQLSILFCQESDDFEKRWMGERVGPVRAQMEFGFDETYPMDEVEALLPEMLNGIEQIYYSFDSQKSDAKWIQNAIQVINKNKRIGWQAPIYHIELSRILDELRLVKMGDEIARMRKAASISAKAHMRAMRVVKPGMYEYELEAEFIHEFIKHGARDVAYSSIVAGGENACVLHYIRNDHKIKEGDLVLIDAGCEYQGYASDITRTFPANGKFSSAQRAVYEIVLESQLAAIDQAYAGQTWDQMQKAIVEVLVAGLVALGVLEGDLAELIENKAYQPYYMHNSGHWLGLDVHDVGDYKVNQSWRKLEPGMVLTIEPGLYFPKEDLTIPEAYRGIGIRIEDDVLITDQAPDIFSKEVPKAMDDIEHLMKN